MSSMAKNFYGSSASSRPRNGPRGQRQSSYHTSTAYRPRVLQPRQLTFNVPQQEVRHYKPGMELEEIPYNSREESSSNDDLNPNDDSFNFENISPSSFTETSTNHSMPSFLGSHGNSDIITMLQQQQAMLQQVVNGQKAFELRQNQLEEKVQTLQSQIDKPSSSTTSSSSSDGKRKRVVTRTLSVCLLNYFVL